MLDTTMRITNMRITKRQMMVLVLLLLSVPALTGCGGSEVAAQGPTVEERLAILEADLAEREQRLLERSAELEEREQELAGNYQELAGRLEDVVERERELDDRVDGLAARAEGVNAREDQLNRREEALGDSESRLAAERQTLDQTLVEARAEAEREAARAAEIARRNPPMVTAKGGKRNIYPEGGKRNIYAEIDLEARTRLEVEFMTTVSSASSRTGDTFLTRITQDLYAGDGRLVVPAGTELEGVVTEAVPLRRVGGQARLGLAFGELHLPWGKSTEVNASLYDAGRNESRRDRRIIGGAAAGGAVLGAILDDDEGRGTILGAIIGAAAGTAAAANNRRDEIEISGGTVVTLQLDESAKVQVPWKSRYSEVEVARAGER